MSSNKKYALITGILGQDGSYLTKLLLSKQYTVFGIDRNINDLSNFLKIGINPEKVNFITIDEVNIVVQNDFEIYNLAGQSSVGKSWQIPQETFESNVAFYISLLNQLADKDVKILQASTGDIFGQTTEIINESTKINPENPYALSKYCAHRYGQLIRNSNNIFITNAILFNHESILRNPDFVTKKIIQGAQNIVEGKQEFIELGNCEIIRDWGLAEDYVEAMWKLLQLDKPYDIIVSSGHSISLFNFIALVFNYFGISNYERYIKINADFFRPNDQKEVHTSPILLNSLGIHLDPINNNNISKLINI